jgi:serine/threonine-protein kinase
MALEPWVRRFWPEVLITWTRLWQGQWRDPLVGRDVLIGAVAGVVFALYSRGVNARLIALLKLPLVGTLNSETLQGTGSVLALLLGNVRNGISAVMLVLALLFFLRLALRKQWLAFAAYVLVMSAPSALQSSYRWIALPFQFGVYSIVGFVMLRRGAFAGMMMLFVANNLTSALFTSNYAAWYGESSWMVLVMIAAMGTWGYWTATEGRSLFADAAAGNAQG